MIPAEYRGCRIRRVIKNKRIIMGDLYISIERKLTYTEKESKEDFGLPKEVMDDIYEVYVMTKDKLFQSSGYSFVDVLNEVFYQITCIYDSEDAAEYVKEYMYQYRLSLIQMNEDENVHRYIYLFVWLMLNMQASLPSHVSLFLKVLDKELSKDAMISRFTTCKYNHGSTLNMTFPIRPTFEEKAISSYPDKDILWYTNHFEADSIRLIVSHYPKKQRPDVVEDILSAYERYVGTSKKNVYSFEPVRVEWEFFQDLMKEVSAMENEEDELPDIPSNANILVRTGFEQYILKDHARVLQILMLVTHMGNRQLPLFIKFIKALQSLQYIRSDCFENRELFIKNAEEKFKSVNFDQTNVKKNIELGVERRDDTYNSEVSTIAEYLKPILCS